MSESLDPRSIEELDVHVGATRVGRLRRTSGGAEFHYLEGIADARLAVSCRLPLRVAPYVVDGVNLHPFFAGLLPEGLRLNALKRGLKTSEDDMFSMLAAVGADTVGAVAVSLVGEQPNAHEPIADFGQLDKAVFRELLERSLQWSPERDVFGDRRAVAGIQPKVSAGMISFAVRAKGAHDANDASILKLEPAEYPKLVANEYLFMTLARELGIDVATVRMLHDRDGQPGLLVARFDRARLASGETVKFGQEDACQLLGRYPADKYRIALRDFAEALDVCTAPIPERLRLLQQIAFSYVIANGDLHSKNLSVRSAEGIVRLAPGYDLLTTLPYGDDAMALKLEGRDKRLRRIDFVAFGERVGVKRAATERMLTTLTERLRRRLENSDKPNLDSIGFEAKATRHLERTLRERCDELA